MGPGWRGVRLTGIVQEEHQRDPPGQHSMPSSHQDPRAEERPGRHSLGPGPHPEEAPRGRALRGRGARLPGDWRILGVGRVRLGQ